MLKELEVETHLIISEAGRKNIELETPYKIHEVEKLGSKVYRIDNLASALSSGSFKTDGMVVVPCTIKTLSGIAHSYNDNLIVKAADVVLKEKRRLILAVRETPLHKGHLELMVKAAELGAIILPPMPAFYHLPKKIEDLIDHTVGKILDLFQIEHALFKRWEGIEPNNALF